MADGIHAKTDLSSVQAGLAKLAGPLRESLARSMAVAGGKVLRDEAKLLAPVGTEEGGSIHPGALRNAIYMAFKDSGSTGKDIRYSVSWNAKKAPHGHLVEFGHWQPYVVAKIPGGYRRITVTRSATARISSSLWVIKMIDLPSLTSVFKIAINSSISAGVSTAVGSSKIMISAPR